jgi:hypothetical protein
VAPVEGMLPFYGARMADLSDMRLVDLVGENSVLGLLSRGVIEPTLMYDALDKCMADFKPGMVILDVLADLFSGEESKREQVTQFMGLLKRLGRKHDCTPLLSAQPSVAGMNTGSGTSGSTGWHNSGRGRMYFQTVKTSDGTEPNKNLRTFEGMKNNYGVRGGKFDLEWKDGLFRRVAGPGGFDRLAIEAKANDVFLALVKRFNCDRRNIIDTKGTAYAPAIFAAQPDAQGVTNEQFRAVEMNFVAVTWNAGKVDDRENSVGLTFVCHFRFPFCVWGTREPKGEPFASSQTLGGVWGGVRLGRRMVEMWSLRAKNADHRRPPK